MHAALAKTRRPEETKRKLIDATLCLMLRQGFSATTVDQICAEAKLTKGSFFHYFENKEAIGHAAVDAFAAFGTELYSASWKDPGLDPLQQLYRIFEIMIGFNRLDEPYVCMVGMMSQEMALKNPAMREVCEGHLTNWTEMIVRMLSAAKKLHPPVVDFDPEKVAWFLNSLWQGSLLVGKTRRYPETIISNIRQARLYVDGLFGLHSDKLTLVGPLVKERRPIRMPRVGTFVRKREHTLTCVGVYNGTNAKNGPYAHAVQEALKDELQKAGIEMDVWINSRPLEQRGEPWQALVKAAERRRFQAFIGIGLNLPDITWQQKLPVPVAFLDAPPSFRNGAGFDGRQFVETSLREIATQGCRSVGLLAPIMDATQGYYPDGSHTPYFDMVEHFMDIATDLGLIVRNDWMQIKDRFRVDPVRYQEQFGYEEFLKLWSLPEKPEGLIVFPDTVARGVILALREKQVRVPEELKLVLHKNESLDLFCPMPVTFMVSSEREIARILIEQVQKQFRGESCERISLPFRLMAHQSASK